MLYFTYRTDHISGKYYVGRHSCSKLDNYLGSGKWIRSIKDKSSLSRTILEYFDNEEELLIAEKILISEHLNKPGNMNFNENSCGWSSDKNPNKSPEARKRLSERVSGDNNPMKSGHTDEAKLKISVAVSGEKNPFYGKTHTDSTKEILRAAQLGRVHSEETREKYRENHRLGKYKHLNRGDNFRNKTHSEESKSRQRGAQNNLPLVKCTHCGFEARRQLIARWHNDNCKKKP